ncbi:MAG: hypothetical protein HOQ24_03845 [Mycobacteriaceae bacterium]|nr:hypothetical protein [Mycobacteriaceae bacterium]
MAAAAAALLVALPASVSGAGASQEGPVITAAALGGDPATHQHRLHTAKPGPPPSAEQLNPIPAEGDQSYVSLDTAQWENAKSIVHAVEDRNLPPYAAVISIATALQESKLYNLTVAVDHDSLGLFQQRPSCGWGSPDQVTNPNYAANAFLNALQQVVPDFQKTPLWQAAQNTQQSAFPFAYAQWQDQAAKIVSQILGKH